MAEAITVAEKIKQLLENLRDDVERTKNDHDAARLALAEALTQFRPVKKGRPERLPVVNKGGK